MEREYSGVPNLTACLSFLYSLCGANSSIRSDLEANLKQRKALERGHEAMVKLQTLFLIEDLRVMGNMSRRPCRHCQRRGSGLQEHSLRFCIIFLLPSLSQNLALEDDSKNG